MSRQIMVDKNAYDDACERVLRDQLAVNRASGVDEGVTELCKLVSENTMAALRLLLFEETKQN